MNACTSCPPHPANAPRGPHVAGDHYGETGACSLCECKGFTAPAIEHVDPSHAEVIQLTRQLADTATALRGELAEVVASAGKRDTAIMEAHDRVDAIENRVAVVERDLRTLSGPPA